MNELNAAEESLIWRKRAEGCLNAARNAAELGDCYCAVNRCYYCIFDAMRAITIFNQIDARSHENIIGNFRRLYIKTGLLPVQLSDIITELQSARHESDYAALYAVTAETAAEYIVNAQTFLNAVEAYLNPQTP